MPLAETDNSWISIEGGYSVLPLAELFFTGILSAGKSPNGECLERGSNLLFEGLNGLAVFEVNNFFK
jgi:hypothetical protein